jgi:diguanylate cyclase (GGDEF)-like protein
MYHKEGHIIWIETTARFIYNEKGEPKGLMGAARDITERRETEEKLRQQATTDPLTEIFNRRYFFEVAQQELERSQRYKRPLSIIIFDIDHFKKINDTYGHNAGDEVLRKLTEGCAESLRENDIFARYGGEEFVILLPETDSDRAEQMAERMRKSCAETPLDVGVATVNQTVSFGVANLNGEKIDLDELLLRADKALYQAKEAGRNRVCLWEKS